MDRVWFDEVVPVPSDKTTITLREDGTIAKIEGPYPYRIVKVPYKPVAPALDVEGVEVRDV